MAAMAVLHTRPAGDKDSAPSVSSNESRRPTANSDRVAGVGRDSEAIVVCSWRGGLAKSLEWAGTAGIVMMSVDDSTNAKLVLPP